MTDTPHTVNAYGVDPNTITQAHADRVARALGLPHAVRIGCGGFLHGISRGVLTITPEPFDLRNPRIASVPWAHVAGLGELGDPSEAMIEAGRNAVMARDCSGPKWTPRQHYKAAGIDMTGIPDWLLDCPGPVPKHIGALLVWHAMNAAAIRDSRTQNATVDVPGQAAEIARLRAEVEALRRLEALAPEIIPALEATGVNVSLAADVRKAADAARTPEVQP